jgi:hypothetical protein
MQKNSNSDYDGQMLDTGSLQIGKKGLDLRQSIDQDSLTSLNNARFSDTTTVERRTGHTSKILQDSSNFASGQGQSTSQWVYGHGNIVQNQDGLYRHHPISTQNLFTFNYDNKDVSWTGDRLLVHQDSTLPSLGTSGFWQNQSGGLPVVSTPSLPQGIPCFLPSMVDFVPPVKMPISFVNGINSYDTAISRTQRILASTAGIVTGPFPNGKVTAEIIDIQSNTIVNSSTISTVDSVNYANIKTVYSGGRFMVFWTDTGLNQLYQATWTGTAWITQVLLFSANDFDLYSTSFNGTYYIIYRFGAVIKARAFLGSSTISTPIIPDTVVDTTGSTPNGCVSLATNPTGQIAVTWFSTTGVWAREYSNKMLVKTGFAAVNIDTFADSDLGISITSATIPVGDNYRWTVYAGYFVYGNHSTGNLAVRIRSFLTTSGATNMDSLNLVKYGCSLQSRAFTVGNETFAWLRGEWFPLSFLLAGVTDPIVCGYADRGESIRHSRGTPPSVSQYPDDQYKFTWARSAGGNGNNTTDKTTNTATYKYSDMDFLPQITAAQYGLSMYLSGSAIQNFDGNECSDAGFQDLPSTGGAANGTGGVLSAGNYQLRVYLVRYNAKGERFVSSAITSNTVNVAATGKINWTILPVTSITANDAVLELYRTGANGTTFTLLDIIANNKNVPSIVYSDQFASDASIASNPGDPYQAQLGGLAEVMQTGPIGCTILISYNDRLWGVGGQVPRGRLQFSKLKIDKFGVGFDALSGFNTIDSEGGIITSIAGMNNSLVAFESDKIFVLQGDGPDNFGRGNFTPAQFAAAKGAITHFGTILTDIGLVYWNEGGPHRLTGQFNVENISDPIRPLAVTLLPTGVRLNPQQQEVVWYTATGTALLLDYKQTNRWATWSGLFVSAASSEGLATTDGRLLKPNSSVYNDGGQTYVFSARTSQLRVDSLLQGYDILKRYGVTGTYEGEHTLELRMYYNGSPLWEEDEIWQPEPNTYLQPASAFGSLTAAQMDALTTYDKSGNYATHRRCKRQNCQRFQLEFLDSGPDGKSFSPQSLEFEFGMRPGFGRSPVTTFTDR